MNHFAKTIARLILIIASFVFAMDHAAAVERPYSASGTAQFTGPNDFVGSGNATHLGRYSETGHVTFAPTIDPAVLEVQGTIIYTAANGDELHASISGTLNAATGVVTATVTYVGGTGRFAHASGAARLNGSVSPTGAARVQVSGKIDY